MDKRCFTCMNKIDSDKCDRCGNDNGDISYVSDKQLAPATVIKEQFYIGNAIEHNGEGFTYIAYDFIKKKRVRIREFFPDNLCFRQKDGLLVSASLKCEIQYKSLMTDFAELSKQIIDMKSNNSLLKAYDIFAENDTLYTVYEDVVGITLTRYLADNLGELSWEETENLFLPLLYTVKLINSNGIIHRGISPDTIIVTQDKELKLSGLCTSGVRVNNSEIRSELFTGYAAPEQYQKCSSHGEWTDVYAVSAVLYRTLTGTMPTRADERTSNDVITTPKQLNPSIPESVSDAIVKGMTHDKDNRTMLIKNLIGSLYSTHQTVNAEQYEETEKKAKRKFKMPIWLTIILILFPIMLIGFLFLLNALDLIGKGDSTSSKTISNAISQPSSDETSSDETSSDEISSETPPSQLENSVVDDFKDKFYDDIVNSDTYKTTFKFTKKEVFDDNVEIGYVIKQSVEANSIKPQGTEIELTVSKGAKLVTLQPFMDDSGNAISLADYQKFLTDSGIESVVEKVSGTGLPSGQIQKLSHSTSINFDREKNDKITIYVAE